MANPTQIRPWSRLGSLLSAPTPESHTNPQNHSSQPLSLKERSTSSLGNNVNATKSLPPTNQSPTQSQKLKLTTPQTFPPSKLKVNPENETRIPTEEEPKTMLVNTKTIEKPSVHGNGSMHKTESIETEKQHEENVTTKEKETKDKGFNTKVLGSEDMRVITIAGENRGAYMEIIKSKNKPIHKKGEVNANRKDKSDEKVRTLSSLPMNTLYINSNVQCVNNSVLFHTSCTHNDPGVHLILSKKPFGKHVEGQRN